MKNVNEILSQIHLIERVFQRPGGRAFWARGTALAAKAARVVK